MGRPVNVTVVEKGLPPIRNVPQLIVARPGDTVRSILTGLGIAPQSTRAVASALNHSAALAGGDVIAVVEDARGEIVGPLEVSLYRSGRVLSTVAHVKNGGYVAVAPRHATVIPADATAAPQKTKDGATLRQALEGLRATGALGPTSFSNIVRLAGRDLDLETKLSASDSSELIYRSGTLAYMELTVAGHTHSYYRYAGTDGGSRFYDASARSTVPSFIRKPVAAGRLGDGFAWRIHPILHKRLFHEGVDFAAPYGSPVQAAASGSVEQIGWEAGYGNFVKVRHPSGYTTVYAHIAGAAPNLKVGDQVHRGQVIARVGSTGLSTGPHLYFELWAQGKRVDPLHAPVQIEAGLDGTDLGAFTHEKGRLDEIAAAGTRLMSASTPSGS